MASPPKRPKIPEDLILTVAKEASDTEIPWANVAPPFFVEWIEEFSCAHNVVKEMMFMAILPSIAALLGSRSSVKPSLQEPYSENFSLFTLCISPPSSGKSQAFKNGAKIPLSHVEKVNEDACILLDKFTDAGLRQHLLKHGGLAAIIKDEMYDTLRAVIAEKEVGTLCRLFDGDSLTSNLGNNSQRVSTEQTSLSLGGFIQVKNFLSEVYPAMISSQNGFEERFLYAVVKPKAMTRRETQVYVNKLQESNLQDLTEIYDAIFRDHKDGLTYTFSAEALSLYDEFDSEICCLLNSRWSMGVLIKDDAELGKDRRQVIRLAVILYVLYTYTRRALFQSYGTISVVVGKTYMEYAINLMKDYFRPQKKTIDKSLNSKVLSSTGSMQSVEKKILDHAGPVVNMRTFRNKFNANSRPTKEETEQAMIKLQDEGFGKFVKSGNTAAFLKQLPSAVDEGKLQFYMSKMSYKDVFCRKNFDLAKQQFTELLSKDPLGDSIQEYLQEQQENIRE